MTTDETKIRAVVVCLLRKQAALNAFLNKLNAAGVELHPYGLILSFEDLALDLMGVPADTFEKLGESDAQDGKIPDDAYCRDWCFDVLDGNEPEAAIAIIENELSGDALDANGGQSSRI